MERLVKTNNVDAKLSSCVQQKTRQPQNAYHEQFCCVKHLVLFTDPSTNDQIALVIDQVHADTTKGTTRTFSELRLSNNIYKIKLP